MDGFTAIGKVQYSLPLSFWRKLVYFAALFLLPAIWGDVYKRQESDKAKTDSFITMQNNAITISDNLDAEVTKLDTVSQNIIYSSILKEEFSDYIEYQQSGRGTDCLLYTSFV